MMSLNAYMHPRNIYKTPLNFEELITSYPELVEFVHRKPNGKLIFDFKNRDGLRCLSTVLLEKDFKLEVKIPEDTLIPTLPLRLNYVLWIEDLLVGISKGGANLESEIKGIDIGTGATCVYPLLIARRSNWKMTAIDIEDSVIQVARENVQNNQLEDFISIVKASSLSDLLACENGKFEFCMCNPPFFKSDEEESELPSKKNRATRQGKAKAQVSGTLNEISSPGGEEEFIKNMIKDSLKLRDRIKIYTTMIGCKATLRPVLHMLKENAIDSFCETQFCQGRTMRWAVAWTFMPISLSTSIPPLPSKSKPAKPISWILEAKPKFSDCVGQIDELLKQLRVEFSIIERDKHMVTWQLKAYKKTWIGQRKMRREQSRKEKTTVDDETTQVSTTSVEDSKGNVDEFNALNEAEPETMIANEKKRKATDETDDSQLSKKLKLEALSAAVAILEAELSVENLSNDEETENKISLHIKYVAGEKEAPQQMLQFLKNKLV